MTKFQIWISGWVELACSIATILTLGYYIPSWNMYWCAYCVLKQHQKEKKVYS